MHGRAGRHDRESGSTAIELVLWTPLLFFILFLLFQLGLFLFAQHVADTAAQAGARTARQDEATDKNWQNEAVDAAASWVDNLIGPGISGPITTTPTIQGDPDPGACTPPIVTVEVAFTMNSVFGGMSVHAQSAGPVENFYPEC
ncbi:MAG TPA: TadE/TadG family type IV pilus assembly protein [Actinocrinis sp.]|nr:TadE/TadG family type IV pilus assembly protein [Actinocrinis sp.]